MIYVKMQGHEYEYQVRELVKLFFLNRKIKFISEKALVKNQSLLIENSLINQNNKYRVVTVVSKGEKVLSKYEIEDINSIDIKIDNITKKIQIGIKQSIYKCISNISEVNAPWGILTGIRPTKIVHELFDKEYDEKIIYKIMETEYLLNEEKIKLLINVAKKERKHIYPMDENRFSLYVSIPFCPTRCLYCSFPSNSLEKCGNLVDDYTDSLIYEIEEVGKLLKDKRINTLYIGGGTPTAIPVDNLDRIIKKLYEVFDKNEIKEFTVEAGRPDTITEDMLLMLKENEVHRLSINPQTMKKETLELIGRKHDPSDIITAYNKAKKIGFDSINMDIILGLPNENKEDIINTLEEIMKLSPDNLTVHTMAVKRASNLKKNIDEISLTQQKVIEEMVAISKIYARKMGMEPYYMYRQKQILGNFENVGYSNKGKECIYNMEIMEEKENIIALGAGGVSKMFYHKDNKFERVPNIKDVRMYMNRIDEMVKRKKKFLKPVDMYR